MKRVLLKIRQYRSWVAVLIITAAVIAGAADLPGLRRNDKAAYADPKHVSFVRPGLAVTITSAQITPEGVISVLFNIADLRGLPLDREGITTPASVALSFVAAFIPEGQTQYTAYTTRRATGTVGGTVTQAAADTGGAYTKVADGQYRYT
ncbi:MAG: hypothetical protein H7Y20_06305, partial [Bryobacteraceae bacterium]|nr:hypothetical protein [Bryobacteraceae bacterium]